MVTSNNAFAIEIKGVAHAMGGIVAVAFRGESEWSGNPQARRLNSGLGVRRGASLRFETYRDLTLEDANLLRSGQMTRLHRVWNEL